MDINTLLQIVPEYIAKYTVITQGFYANQITTQEPLNSIKINNPILFLGIDYVFDTDVATVKMIVDGKNIISDAPLNIYPKNITFSTGIVDILQYDWGYPYATVSFNQNIVYSSTESIYTKPYYRMIISPADEVVSVKSTFSLDVSGVPKGYSGVVGYMFSYVDILNPILFNEFIRDKAKTEGVC